MAFYGDRVGTFPTPQAQARIHGCTKKSDAQPSVNLRCASEIWNARFSCTIGCKACNENLSCHPVRLKCKEIHSIDLSVAMAEPGALRCVALRSASGKRPTSRPAGRRRRRRANPSDGTGRNGVPEPVPVQLVLCNRLKVRYRPKVLYTPFLSN